MDTPRFQLDEGRRFSRPWWLGVLRDAMWAMLISVLIWIFADLQHTETQEITVTVVLASSDPDKRVISPTHHKVTFTLAGARRDLETFRAEFNNKPLAAYDVGSYESGVPHAIPTLTILRTVPQLEQMGLSIQSVSPDTLSGVMLAELVTREVPIEFTPPPGYTLSIPAVITPDKVGIRITPQAWQRLTANPAIPPVIRTVPPEPAQYQPGQTVQMPVTPQTKIGDEPIALTNPRQTYVARFTVGEPPAEKSLTVPLAILSPVTWAQDGTWQRFLLQRNPAEGDVWRITVVVTGSKADIGKVSEENLEAFIVLRERHKAKIDSWESESVQVRILGDVKLTVKQVSPATIGFRLRLRAEVPASP